MELSLICGKEQLCFGGIHALCWTPQPVHPPKPWHAPCWYPQLVQLCPFKLTFQPQHSLGSMRPPCLLSGPYPPVIGSICGPPTKVRTPTELAAAVPRIPTPACPGAPAFTLPVGEVVSAPFAWPASSLVGEPRGIGISNPGGCISAPELPTSSLDHLTRITRVLCVSRSSATMRKFRLTTTACASCASTYALGPCRCGDADKTCKNTQVKTKLKFSLDLAPPFSRNTRKQAK